MKAKKEKTQKTGELLEKSTCAKIAQFTSDEMTQ